MEIKDTFGETVKKLRESKSLTLREVAEHLGIDTSMLGKIEKNSRKPTKQLIEKFAVFFEVNAKSLTLAFLSDTVAYQILGEEDMAHEVFQVAEEKVRYLAKKKKNEK